jgi:hypothetical protein
VILHCHGSHAGHSLPPPEDMQFTAYITRDEVEQHSPTFDAAISRIAQIFAADVMPQQCKNYEAKCSISYAESNKAVLVNRAASTRTPLLMPPALFNSSMYTFRGYHPGYLESFLLQPIYNSLVARSDNTVHGMSTDHRTRGFPLPAVIDKAIRQLAFKRPLVSSAVTSSSSTQAPRSTPIVSAVKSEGDEAVKEASGLRAAGKMAGKSQVSCVVASASKATLFGTPVATKLFQPVPVNRSSSPISISSISTVDYSDGKDDSPPMNGLISFKREGVLAAPSTLPALAPIISMGRNSEAVIAAADLPDTVHTYLWDLVAKKVTTAWIANLQAPPLSLSSITAQAVYAAVLQDLGGV